MLERYNDISISAFETLKAPRVGFDARADEWALKMHAKQRVTTPLDDYLKKMRGYYVVMLAGPCDGIPYYSNGGLGYVERFSFRAQFLKSCLYVIGEELLEQAYTLKLVPDLLLYGRRLRSAADEFARMNGMEIPGSAPADPDAVESHLHIVVAVGRWCQYWAERGHFLEAYF